MSHYESMEPCTNDDIERTIKLVRDYEDGNYRYKKKDIPYLLALPETSQEIISLKKDPHENISARMNTREERSSKTKSPQQQNKTHINKQESSYSSKRRKMENQHEFKTICPIGVN